MTQLTKQQQLTHLRRRLRQIETVITEAIAEREQVTAELRQRSQVATDELAAGWLAEQGAAAVNEVIRILGCRQ